MFNNYNLAIKFLFTKYVIFDFLTLKKLKLSLWVPIKQQYFKETRNHLKCLSTTLKMQDP